MKQIYKPILINTLALLAAFFCLYGIAVDLPFVRKDLVHYYIAGRIFCFVSLMYIAAEVNIFKRQYPLQVPFLYAILLIYCVHGNMFVPCYYLGFMQIATAVAFFFPMNKKEYNIIHFTGLVAMIASIWLTTGSYTADHAMDMKFKVDATFGVIIITILIYTGYLSITLVREKQRLVSEKFLEVGRNFGDLIHGLKGQFSSPIIYVELLKRELEKSSPDLVRMKEIVSSLGGDIKTAESQIKSINSISKNDTRIDSVNVKEVINSVIETFFKNKTDRIKVTYEGKDTYKTNDYMIRSIAINAIKNALENFEEKKVKNPEIHISLNEGVLTFKDNGGGFSPEALKKFKKAQFYTEKENGSGLGLFLIRGTIESFGGKLTVSNFEDSALVNIHLNKEPKI